MRKSRKLATDRAKRFCSALATETRERPNWWASINSVANRMGIDDDQAVAVAEECERAGYVMHDQSQHTKDEVRASRQPHSATLRPAGWGLIKS